MSNDDSDAGVKRSLLIWVGAAVVQLQIWETALAEHFVVKWNNEAARSAGEGRRIWVLDVHRNSLIVALDHMLTALDFLDRIVANFRSVRYIPALDRYAVTSAEVPFSDGFRYERYRPRIG